MQYHYTSSPDTVRYQGDFSSQVQLDELYNRDLEDAYTKYVQPKLKEFGKNISEFEEKFKVLNDKITEIRKNDTTIRKIGRVLQRIGIWTLQIVSIITVVPAIVVIVNHALSNKDQRYKPLDKIYRISISLTSKEEREQNDKFYELQKEYRKNRLTNPLHQRVFFGYQTTGAMNDFQKTLDVERLEQVYSERIGNPGKMLIDVEKKKDIESRYNEFNRFVGSYIE